MKKPHSEQIKDLKAKLAENGFSSDYQVTYGYWAVTVWKTDWPTVYGKGAGITPMSATLAAVLELIKNHV